MGYRASIVAAWLLALAATGCTEKGSYTLSFTWDQPPAEKVYVWAQVEERPDGLESTGTVLKAAGPVVFDATAGVLADLDLSDVPNGDDRVVVVRVRAGTNENLRVLYYGISEPFVIAPDTAAEVPIRLQLQEPEAETPTATVELFFDESDTPAAAVNANQARNATLVTRATGAVAVVLANDPSFSANLTTHTFDDLDCETHQEWSTCAIDGWDLLAGLPPSEALTDGRYSVFARFVDRYGYESSVVRGSVQLDTTGPQVLSASVSPEAAKLGDDIFITVNFHEPINPDAAKLVVTPAATAPNFTGPEQVGDSNAYVWHAVAEETADGNDFEFAIVVKDDLGNPTAVDELVTSEAKQLSLFVDASVPVITDIATNLGRYSAQPGYDTVVVSFKTTEAVDVAPSSLLVTVAGQPMSCSTWSLANPGYTCSYTVIGDEPEGSAAVQIAAIDGAGNSSTGTTTVVFDFTPPTLLASSAAPDPGWLGGVLFYSVFASEPLGDVPTLSLSGPGTIDFMFRPDTEFIYDAVLTSAAGDGTYTATVDLVDEVGNAAMSIPASPFEVDTTVPVISNLATQASRFSAVPGFDLVTLTFDASEDMADALSVTLGSTPMDCASYVDTAPNYTCSAKVTDTSPQGLTNIVVAGADAAGNLATPVSTAVTVDRTAPDIAAGSVSLGLTPAATSPLATVDAVSAGTAVRVSFALTETPAEAPEVATVAPAGLAFVPLSSAGSVFSYEHSLAGLDHIQGTYSVQVSVADDVGNQAIHALQPTFEVDTTLPAPAATDTPDTVVYTRIPWGSAATFAGSPTAHFSVQGAPGAVEANATVLVLDGPTPGVDSELGRAQADALGAFGGAPGTPEALALNNADRAVVYVVAVDAAGNMATARAVRDVTWTASLGGKVALDPLSSPHQFLTSRRFSGALVDAAMAEVGGADLAAVGGPLVATEGGATWRQRQPSTPLPRVTTSMAFDSRRGVAVMFGGVNYLMEPARFDDTWEFDGHSWWPITPTDPEVDGNPEPLLGGSLAFDSRRNVTVMYGGARNKLPYSDVTWEWNGSSWRRVTITDPEGDGAPGPLTHHAMVYDSRRGVMVVFGGGGGLGVGYVNDTWEYDGASWTLRDDVAGADGIPSIRGNHKMAFDEARGVTVLFGGSTGLDHFDDTWEYDGETWALRTPEDPEGDGGPTPGAFKQMAYDAARQVTVLFSGADGSDGLDELWEWDGVSWALQAPADPEWDGSPRERSTGSMVFDSARGRTLLFGGYAGEFGVDGYLANDTWAYNGDSWRRLGPADAKADGEPPQLSEPHMTWDAERRVVVLFGGSGDLGQTDATWEFDGVDWLLRSLPASPPRTSSGRMVYDSARQVTVLVGGHVFPDSTTGATWEYDGATWALATPTQEAPPRADMAMAYDSARGVVVMHGGHWGNSQPTFGYSNETWEYDGVTWTKATPPDPEFDDEPSSRISHEMVYDSQRQVMVLFGGRLPNNNQSSETWEYDGTSWALREPADPEGDGNPGPRQQPAMAYDSDRGVTVLRGGTDIATSDELDDTWEWNGVSWRRILAIDPELDGGPGLDAAARMVYDPMRRTMIHFGGFIPAVGSDHWSFERRDHDRPGHRARFAFAAAGAGQDVLIQQVDVSWVAGGVGYDGVDCASVEGAEVLVWRAGRWHAAASTDAGPNAPAPVAWSTTDAEVIDGLFLGPQQVLTLAATTTATNGCDANSAGVIASDYMTVSVRYRRP